MSISTKIFGILAHPAGHSLSPVMHNAAFEFLNIDANFKTFDIKPENLDDFFLKVRKDQIVGLAVSVPHKRSVIKYLDHIDNIALQVGAVNTIYWKGGKLCGTNTDVQGFTQSLLETSYSFSRVLICGAGGASRAVVYALKSLGIKNITIWNRDVSKAQSLADLFCCKVATADFHDLDFKEFDLLINATVVGMYPHVKQSIIPKKFWFKHHIAYDLVMNPLMTMFLQDAQSVGCRLIYGYKMLLYQGAAQFLLWHNQKPPIKIMENVLLKELSLN